MSHILVACPLFATCWCPFDGLLPLHSSTKQASRAKWLPQTAKATHGHSSPCRPAVQRVLSVSRIPKTVAASLLACVRRWVRACVPPCICNSWQHVQHKNILKWFLLIHLHRFGLHFSPSPAPPQINNLYDRICQRARDKPHVGTGIGPLHLNSLKSVKS